MLTHSGRPVEGFGLGLGPIQIMPSPLPQHPACPGGTWELLPYPGHCACPTGWSWSAPQNKCLQNINTATPIQTAVPLTKGRSYKKVITSSTGVLPAAYRGLTKASYQATVNPANWKVISVAYDPTGEKTLTVVADYCGPTASVVSPDTTNVGNMIVLHGTWSNIGPAAASSCGGAGTGSTQQQGSGSGSGAVQTPAATTSSTGTYVAIGAGALVVIGGIALAMSSKKKRR